MAETNVSNRVKPAGCSDARWALYLEERRVENSRTRRHEAAGKVARGEVSIPAELQPAAKNIATRLQAHLARIKEFEAASPPSDD
jgi:hypothetical protein